MSSLLDRYIYAVERHLPKGAPSRDIGAELRETIQSRIDEEAADRGRDLTEAELAAILKSVGRPVAVAGRYDSTQYVIGPSLYPYFRATLKALVTIALPLVIVGAVVGAIAAENPVRGAFAVVGRSINAAWVVFGIVTLLFWQMGRVTPNPNFDQAWNPLELPQLPGTPHAVPRAQSISGAAFVAVYLLWWIDLLPLPQLLQSWAAVYLLQPAPIWEEVWLAIALLGLLQLAVHLLNIWQPVVPRWRVGLQMLGDLGSIGVIYVLVKADQLIVVPTGGRWAAQQELLNDVTRLGLLALAFLIVLGLVVDEGKRIRGGWGPQRPDPPTMARGAARAALRAAGFGASRAQNGGRTRHP